MMLLPPSLASVRVDEQRPFQQRERNQCVRLPETFLLRVDESSQGRGHMRALLVLRRITGALAANGIQGLELERFKLLDDFVNFMRAVTGVLLCAVAYSTDETGRDPSVFWKLQFMRIAVLGRACNGCSVSSWAAAGRSKREKTIKNNAAKGNLRETGPSSSKAPSQNATWGEEQQAPRAGRNQSLTSQARGTTAACELQSRTKHNRKPKCRAACWPFLPTPSDLERLEWLRAAACRHPQPPAVLRA